MSEIILSNPFDVWYWSLDKTSIRYFTVWQSTIESVRHNGGTAVMGGVVITFSRIYRVISTLWRRDPNKTTRKLVDSRNDDDSHLHWFNEINVRAYTRNALIMCGIYGKGFRISAERAYQLISRNTLQSIDTDMLAGIVLGYAKVFITISTGIGSWMYFHKRFEGIALMPFLVLIVGSYSIADVFLSVYSVAVDTVILCAREYH